MSMYDERTGYDLSDPKRVEDQSFEPTPPNRRERVTGILEIPASQYHADEVGAEQPSLSASIIKTLISASPAHAREAHPKLNPHFAAKVEDKFELGTASHALFFEGDAGVQVCDYENWRTKAAQEDAALARAHGKIPMLPGQWAECQGMVAAMRDKLAALHVRPRPFTAGKPEQTIVWEEAGVHCRARLDWLFDSYEAIDDMKSTYSANPDVWTKRTLFDIGADVQYVFYRRGIKALTGITPQFRFVVIETKPPYELSVVALEPEADAFAELKVDKALALWKQCLATDTWPGYPKDVCYATLPPWLESQWYEREAREDVAA